MTTIFNIRVELSDDREFTVKADQRDIARFEREPFGVPFYQIAIKPFTFLQYIAWNAGRRQRLHTLSWGEWEDQCVQVEDLDKLVQGEDPPQPDPGQSAASAES